MEQNQIEKLIKENKKLRRINRILAFYAVMSLVIMLYNMFAWVVGGFAREQILYRFWRINPYSSFA